MASLLIENFQRDRIELLYCSPIKTSQPLSAEAADEMATFLECDVNPTDIYIVIKHNEPTVTFGIHSVYSAKPEAQCFARNSHSTQSNLYLNCAKARSPEGGTEHSPKNNNAS